MTEIPEHLLQRSKERRKALGLPVPGEEGGEAEAPAAPPILAEPPPPAPVSRPLVAVPPLAALALAGLARGGRPRASLLAAE